MRGIILRGVLLLVAVLTGSRCAAAETADTVLARAASAYTSASAIALKAYTRSVMVGFPQGQDRTMGSRMNRHSFLIFRMLNPDDWYAAAWDTSQMAGSPGMPMTSHHAPILGRYVLARSGTKAGQLISFHQSGFPAPGNGLPGGVFAQMLRDRVIQSSPAYLALAPLLDAVGGSPFELTDARLVGSEPWGQHDTWRIEGEQEGRGEVVEMWIDRETGMVLRTVMTSRTPAQGTFPHMVTETIYKTTLGAPLSDDDFALQPPSDDILQASAQMDDDDMGFGPVADLAQYGTTTGAAPGQSAAPPSSQALVPAPAPIGPTAQALSSDQMDGIVLITGDDSTATGFMTKIHGIDFVVTNQHVLGDNKSITVQDMSGNTIPVLAIYGAVGRDVAILRIAKGAGTLTPDANAFQNVKIGDPVVVVGNRLGGGVATQTSGHVLGVGPTRIEIDANFEPGNSGSPIFDLSTHDVVGVATYQETRQVNVDEGSDSSRYRSQGETNEVEKRWFGFRIDGITQWQAIDLDRWHAQAEQLEKFRNLSDALVSFIHDKLNDAADNDQLAPYITTFQSRVGQVGNNQSGRADAVKDMIRSVHSVAAAGIDDLSSGDFYDYYRTCLYWEDSIPMQIEYRKRIIEVLEKYENESGDYISRLRGGGY